MSCRRRPGRRLRLRRALRRRFRNPARRRSCRAVFLGSSISSIVSSVPTSISNFVRDHQKEKKRQVDHGNKQKPSCRLVRLASRALDDVNRNHIPRPTAPTRKSFPSYPKKKGARLTGISIIENSTICRAVIRPAGSTTGSIRIPAFAYSSRYIHAMARKCGNCQRNCVAKKGPRRRSRSHLRPRSSPSTAASRQDRANSGRYGRSSFERRVNEHVARDRRCSPKHRRERIDREKEIDLRDQALDRSQIRAPPSALCGPSVIGRPAVRSISRSVRYSQNWLSVATPKASSKIAISEFANSTPSNDLCFQGRILRPTSAPA